MKSTSLDLSGKIDPVTVDLLSKTNEVAKKIKVDFFVIGATARDLILEKGFGISIGRSTADLDLGVLVNGWKTYSKLKDKLLSTGQFIMDNRTAHRLLYKSILPLDMIPFGKVESPPGSIEWPLDRDTRMNVMGFQEAYDHALIVRVAPNLDVRFVSLPGLAVLKLIAWSERSGEAASKDAADLVLLLKNYVNAGNMKRLYEEHSDLLLEEGHDQDRAGARLLGQDMSELMTGQTRAEVLGILRNNAGPGKSDRLIIAISKHLGMDAYEEDKTLLECLTRGIKETPHTEEK